MSEFPWIAWIALATIASGLIITVIGQFTSRDDPPESALEQGAESLRQIMERLDQMDARLAVIEKTLTDIP